MLAAVSGSSWMFLLCRTLSCICLLIKSSNLLPFSCLTISCLISRLFSSTSLRPLFLLSMSLLGILLLERWKPRFLFDFSGM